MPCYIHSEDQPECAACVAPHRAPATVPEHICAALRHAGFRANVGRKRSARMVVVKGVAGKQAGYLQAVARRHAALAVVIPFQSYAIIQCYEQSDSSSQERSEPGPIRHGGYGDS